MRTAPELRRLTPIGEETQDTPAAVDTGGASRTQRWGEAAAAAVAALVALTLLLWTAAAAYVYVPYSDVHDWAKAVFQAERSHDWLGYLWSPHTAQRIVWARLVEAAEIEQVRSRWPVFLYATGVAWVAGAAAVLARVGSAAALRVRTRVWLAAAAVLILANVAMAEDAGFPMSSLYLFSAGPAVAAVALAAGGESRGWRSLLFWAALAMALAASAGGAAGLAVWPVLAVLALLQPGSRGRFWTVCLVGSVTVALFRGGLGLPSSSLGAGGGGVAHLLKQGVYFLAFCGLPWSRVVHPPAAGALLGAPVVFASAWVLRDAWRRRGDPGRALPRIGAALVVFGLLTAVLAAVGRVDELPAPIVPERYSPFSAVLQLGVILGLCDWLDERLRRPASRTTLGAAALIVLLLVADVKASHAIRRSAASVRTASHAFDTGARSVDGIVIHPRPEFAHAVRRALIARGLPG